VWQARDVGIRGLDIGGSATWTDAVVKANAANPAQVGKTVAAHPQAALRRAGQLPAQRAVAAGGGLALERPQRTTPRLNIDSNPDTYGGTSRVNQLDLKASWKFAKQWEWALGINNVTNQQSWQAHTMPQRSVQTELRLQHEVP
jgi:iron complex outermembrane receptor protein